MKEQKEETTSKKSTFWFNVLCISAITYHSIISVIALVGLLHINYLENSFSLYDNNQSSLVSITLLMFFLLIINVLSITYLILYLSKKIKWIFIYIILLALNMIIKAVSFSFNWYEISLIIVYITFFVISSTKTRRLINK